MYGNAGRSKMSCRKRHAVVGFRSLIMNNVTMIAPAERYSFRLRYALIAH